MVFFFLFLPGSKKDAIHSLCLISVGLIDFNSNMFFGNFIISLLIFAFQRNKYCDKTIYRDIFGHINCSMKI